jgi:hypothetical protein
MKSFKYSLGVALLLFAATACDQEIPELQEPEPAASQCEGAKPGSANFSKFVAIGNSFVAGFQAGALFTDGQNNSLPAILNKQFECVGAPATFKQPDIKASLGYNIFIAPNPPADNKVRGRMLLQTSPTPDCATGLFSPRPTPQAYAVGNLEAVPNPQLNPNFIYGDGSTKSSLNNFGIPAIVLGQALIPQTGNWALAGADPRFSPFYGRLAYPGTGTSTLIGDAAAAGGTFFLFWLGMDDFFLYAANGADPAKAPLTPATGAGPASFDLQYGGAIATLLGSNADLKGVVANFPDIFKMPHFTAVAHNPIPMDATTAATVNGAFGGYNQVLDGLIANAAAFGISDDLKAQIGTRKVTFAAGCNNKVVINDEGLVDLGGYFDAMQSNGFITADQRSALIPYEQIRQTTPTDVLPLGAGSVIGTTVGGNPLLINGVSVPLADQYVITPAEKTQITDARNAYNAIVSGVVAANTTRLALADVNMAMDQLAAAQLTTVAGTIVSFNINPPTGIFSEDGVHPNSRGYAFLSRTFIEAINAKFGATIPLTPVGWYKPTALPIP